MNELLGLGVTYDPQLHMAVSNVFESVCERACVCVPVWPVSTIV